MDCFCGGGLLSVFVCFYPVQSAQVDCVCGGSLLSVFLCLYPVQSAQMDCVCGGNLFSVSMAPNYGYGTLICGLYLYFANVEDR